MARLVLCGFEQQSLVYGAEGQGMTIVGAGPAIETSVVHSGGASLKVASANGAHAMRFSNTAILADGWSAYVAGRAYYLRSYFRFSAAPATASPPILRFESGTTRQGEILLNPSGQLVLRSAAPTTLQTSSALSANTWYRVELMIQQDAAHASPTTTGTLEMRIDGVSVGGPQTGIDAGALDITRFVVGQNSTNPGITMYWDDVALNDDQGGVQDSWPGDGYVELLKPASDTGTIGDWKRGDNTGGTLAPSVDNVPPTGKALASAAAGDQIRISTGTPGTAAANYIPNLTAYGSGKRIRVLQALATIGNSTTTPRFLGFRVQSNPSGDSSVAPGSIATAAATFPTGWVTYRGNAIYDPSVDLSQGPHLLVERVETVEEQTVCALGAYVEYQTARDVTPATETDAAQAQTAVKRVTITPTTETDQARRLVTPLRPAQEADVAQAANVDKSVTRTPAAEADSAQALVATKPIYKTLTAVTETDVAQAVDADKKVALASVVETDTAQALAVTGPKTLGAASETDVAQALNVDKRVASVPASETNAAQVFDTDKQVAATPAAETDTAQALTITRPIYVSITPATETDEAQALPAAAEEPGGGGFLPRVAPVRAVRIRRPIIVSIQPACEQSQALPLESRKTPSLVHLREEEELLALI